MASMTDIPPMVERVARALCLAASRRLQAGIAADPTMAKYWMSDEHVMRDVENGWHHCVPAARAAIEAMREPTEEMIAVGENPIDAPDHSLAHVVWWMMVEAALTEEP